MIHAKTKNVTDNVKYEFDMLEWTYFKLSNDDASSKQEKNAYIECFLIHARNLTDFFSPQLSAQNDDVLASHFFDNAEVWKSHESNLCQYIKSQRSDINKTLAHLTYYRVKPKQWEGARIYDELRKAKNLFFELLTPEQRKSFK